MEVLPEYQDPHPKHIIRQVPDDSSSCFGIDESRARRIEVEPKGIRPQSQTD